MGQFKHDYPFIIETRVEWGDMDAFQHVNNTVYFRYFERVRIDLFAACGYRGLPESSGVGPVLASIQCRFRAPLGYPDEILIGMRITEIGGARISAEYGIYSKASDRVVATGDGVSVFYDFNKDKKSRIADDIRRKLQAYMTG